MRKSFLKKNKQKNKQLFLLFSITILLVFLTACADLPIVGPLLGGSSEEGLVLPESVSQWATSASASSAYGGIYGANRDDQSPFAATGEPDVKKCEDDQKAWVIDKEDDGLHWIELEYFDPLYISTIRIRETLGPGAVVKIEALDNIEYKTLWEGVDKNTECPGFFEFDYEEEIGEGNISITRTMTSFKSDTIRLTLDTDVEDWNEIDAVEIIGYKDRWHVFNNTVVVDSVEE